MLAITEEQAKKLKCHQVLHTTSMINCHASKCMAWRWYTFEDKDYDDKVGYCGLVINPRCAMCKIK